VLTAPGQPGSIERGREDQRGYELIVEPPARARKVELEVSFELRRSEPPR
jgi:hypothetical protein